MKILLVIFALMFSINALAVDMVITFTPAQATRFAVACGSLQGLMDTQTPPVPRSCTMPEAKAFVITRLRSLVFDVENTVATKAARDAMVIPAFDPQ
jgi:hypothetical protein